MRIWIDSTTPKSIRLAHAVIERFPDNEYLHTVREGWETRGMTRILRIEGEAKFVGHHGLTRTAKLAESIERQRELLELIEGFVPESLYSHCSVEAIRIASALGIPIVSTNDSPWSRWVERLTIPLVDHHLTPWYTRKMWRIQPKGKRVLYQGIDEWTWIKGLIENGFHNEWKPRHVLVREPEHYSNYFNERLGLREAFEDFEGNVKFVGRYHRKDVFRDAHKLLKGALCVVGIGGTINREATLLGIPSILIKVKAWVTGIYGYLQTLGPAFLASDVSQGVRWMERFWGETLHALPLDKTITKKLQSPLDALGEVLDGG